MRRNLNLRQLLPLFAVCLATLPGGQADDGAAIRLISERPGPQPAGLSEAWPTVLTHTHNWRFAAGEKPGNFEEAERSLAQWAVRMGIRAIGVGSAWSPEVEANFARFEGPDRDLYYSDKFDQKSVMDTANIEKVLRDLNEWSGHRTLFYLDNETPKGRMSHVWWFGYKYDYPAWHDYSQDRPIKFFESDPSAEINPLTGEPHTRRNLFEIMAIQRSAGALGIFAHPTRWWVNDGKFITNIAAMSGLFLVVDGYLDGITMMGDRPFNKPYQDLWFHFLDTGSKVPGFAETDFFLNKASAKTKQETFLNHMHLGSLPVTEQNIRDVAGRGELFASNGAFLTASVDGIPIGSICRTADGKHHRLRIEVYPEPDSSLTRIEVIGKQGALLAVKSDFRGGVLEYDVPGTKEASYVIVRAFGPGDQVAVTNPVYLWPAGFQIQPARTRCVLHVPERSRWSGGTAEFQQADGRLIERRQVVPGVIRIDLPANARIVLTNHGQKDRMFYIAMENREVEKNLSYLINGEFRRDYPGLSRSQLPPEAFHLTQLRKAIRTFEYDLN